MSLLILIIFFKSICLFMQNIVLGCYEKFLNPKQKYYLSSSGGTAGGSTNNQCRRGNRSSVSTSSALNRLRALERERLIEQIRARKRNRLRVLKTQRRLCADASSPNAQHALLSCSRMHTKCEDQIRNNRHKRYIVHCWSRQQNTQSKRIYQN